MKKLTLFYCDAHDVWTSWECPECHLAANAKDLRSEGYRQGIQAVATWLDANRYNPVSGWALCTSDLLDLRNGILPPGKEQP